MADDEHLTLENTNNFNAPVLPSNAAYLLNLWVVLLNFLKIASKNILLESASTLLKEQANELHNVHVLWNKSQIIGVTSVRISFSEILGFKHKQTATEEISEDQIKIIKGLMERYLKYFSTMSNQDLH